jgi:hypothetical protein
MALPQQINPATPPGTEDRSLGDDRIRELKRAINDIFGIPDATNINNALMAVTASGLRSTYYQDAGSDPVVAGEIRRNAGNLRYHTGTQVVTLGEAFPSGTRMVFDQDTPPTGWTRDTAIDDRVVRIVSGARVHGGSWTISGLSNSSEPNHQHTGSLDFATQGTPPAGSCWVGLRSDPYMRFSTSGTFTGQGETVPARTFTTAAAGGHTHTISSDGSWRPPTRDMIVAVKS